RWHTLACSKMINFRRDWDRSRRRTLPGTLFSTLADGEEAGREEARPVAGSPAEDEGADWVDPLVRGFLGFLARFPRGDEMTAVVMARLAGEDDPAGDERMSRDIHYYFNLFSQTFPGLRARWERILR